MNDLIKSSLVYIPYALNKAFHLNKEEKRKFEIYFILIDENLSEI